MLNKKSFLALDCGATNLKLAEFELTEVGGLCLRQYGIKSLGQDGTQEATREGAVQAGLQQLLSDAGFAARQVNLCAPGFHTFSKFVKLPPVDTSKVTQIIQYEAQQNVPFPLEEVVWDYQIIGATPTGELEVLLVAIKSDVVEGLSRSAEKAGLRLQLVDVSPAALCNAFRYNYPEMEGCTMLLDIGARTSNLLFFEKGSVYSRGINIGANAITQEFMKESRLAFDEAERLKVEQGFVSLGGAYEEPDNPHQAAISKIARQVLTRLHIQVNQTIQFYRGQQGGGPPDRLFLSGNAASMAYTAQFFAEKLNLPVEYFNPLRNIEIDPAINREELVKVAHSLGEAVGLGLRNLARCPVELNLMPKSSIKRQQFNQKKPYLAAAVFCLILVVLVFGWFYNNLAQEKEKVNATLEEKLRPLDQAANSLTRVMNEFKKSQMEAEQVEGLLEDRLYWGELFGVLRESLINLESRKKRETGRDTGVWIERFVPVAPANTFSVQLPVTTESLPSLLGAAAAPPGDSVVPAAQPPPAPASPALDGRPPRRPRPAPRAQTVGAMEIQNLVLYCRAVSLAQSDPTANTTLAEEFVSELKARTNHFDSAKTQLFGEMAVSPAATNTFTFQVVAGLVKPMRF
jgi:type IV pilus assembly protein PilM